MSANEIAAREYLALGFSIVPIGKDKRPAFDLLPGVNGKPSWDQYKKRLPTDAEIAKWFSDPSVGVGIISGKVSGGLVILDLDDDDARKFLFPDGLGEKFWIAKTSRGYHIYFRTDAEAEQSGTPRGDDLKVEVKYGGYCVAPPSIHPTGHQYQWLVRKDPKQVPKTDKWLELKAHIDRKKEQWEIAKILRVHWIEGQHNDVCLGICNFLRKRRLATLEEVEDFLISFCSLVGDEKIQKRLAAARASYQKEPQDLAVGHWLSEDLVKHLEDFATDGWKEPMAYFEVQVVNAGKPNEKQIHHFQIPTFTADLLRQERFRKADKHGGRLFYYERGVYLPRGESHINAVMKRVLKDKELLAGKKSYQEVVHHVNVQSTIMENEEPADDIHQITFNNGVYDWSKSTNQFRPFDKDKDVFYEKLPWDYPEKDGDWSLIQQFFKDILPEEWGKYMPRFFACCLLRTPIKDANLMLVGPPDSAKTTLMQLAEHILGRENISSVPIQHMDYEKHRFSVIHLKNKLLNLCDDIETEKPVQAGLFKWITGGSEVFGEAKHHDQERFQPYCQHIHSSNAPPDIADVTGAYDVRVKQINFPYKFADNPTHAFEKLIDRAILDKLVPQIPAFLRHIVSLVPDVLKKGMGSPASVEENMLIRLCSSNPGRAFLLVCCEEVRGYRTLRSDFWEDLNAWVNREELSMTVGKRDLTKNWLTTHLPSMATGLRYGQVRIDGRMRECWVGLKVKEDCRHKARTDPPLAEDDSPKNDPQKKLD